MIYVICNIIMSISKIASYNSLILDISNKII